MHLDKKKVLNEQDRKNEKEKDMEKDSEKHDFRFNLLSPCLREATKVNQIACEPSKLV